MKVTRTPACLSDLALDRRAAGELTPDEDVAASAHLADCERCRDRSDALAREAASFDPTPPAYLRPTTRRRWLPAAGGVLALAAALLLFARMRPEDPAERIKGSGRIAYHVAHDGAVRPGSPADRLVPGDAVQLSYSAREATHLAILSVDGAQHVSTYFPTDGERAAPVAAGREVSLSGSIVLDDVLGPETVYALFCDSAVPLEPVRRALATGAPAVEGCTVERLGWEKVAR